MYLSKQNKPCIALAKSFSLSGILARAVSVPVSRLSGNDVSGHYKQHYFLSFFSVVYFSHKGVLNQKTYSAKLTGAPKT